MAIPVRGINAFQLRIKINYAVYRQSFGITEDYWLTASTVANAVAAAQKICNYRTLWLAPGPIYTAGVGLQKFFSMGPYIAYASISRYGPGRDSIGVPLNGWICRPNLIPYVPPTNTPPNDRTSAIEYRFNTAVEPVQQGSRLFRFVSDDWETNIQSSVGFTPPAWSNVAVPAFPAVPTNIMLGVPTLDRTKLGGASEQVLRGYLLTLIVGNCGPVTTLPFVKGPPALQAGSVVTPWGQIAGQVSPPALFIGFSSHRTGHPYGDYRGRAKKRT
jgi:hypothetical protein